MLPSSLAVTKSFVNSVRACLRPHGLSRTSNTSEHQPSLLNVSNHSHIRPCYKYFAVKILTIDATSRHDAGQTRELEFLKMIAARNDTDYLPMLRDSFVEQGPKGKHLCLVQDLYSTSVSALRRSSPHKALPAYIARNIVAMLVDALAQLHEMRIVHTGEP